MSMLSLSRCSSRTWNNPQIWNRMSSTSPPGPVGWDTEDGSARLGTHCRRQNCPNGGLYLEPEVEPQFHPDSYGYRPRKSAMTHSRQPGCWRYDLIDLDIREFFDNLDHPLVMRAGSTPGAGGFCSMCSGVRSHAAGRRVPRTMGTAGASRARSWPISSCTSRSTTGCGQRTRTFRSRGTRMISSRTVGRDAQAQSCGSKRRLAQCRLDVHPEKTHIGKDDDRPGQYPTEQFTFLGYTFPAREESMGSVLHQHTGGEQWAATRMRQDATLAA